ncbi:MAG: hypothetical protein U9N12_03660, partial [Euryarchaeota archaeon]|nr:hypothetical protein [Euryarchaeota archaeon]
KLCAFLLRLCAKESKIPTRRAVFTRFFVKKSDRRFRLTVMRMQRFRHTDKTPASRIIRISGLITNTLRCGMVSHPPSFTTARYQPLVRGSVLRWWLAFPQAGFSPAGEYEFISARQYYSGIFGPVMSVKVISVSAGLQLGLTVLMILALVLLL